MVYVTPRLSGCVIVTDIIDEEGTHCTPVVGGGDRSVPLLSCLTMFTSLLTSDLHSLTCSIPDLSLYGLPVNLNGSSGELNSDG